MKQEKIYRKLTGELMKSEKSVLLETTHISAIPEQQLPFSLKLLSVDVQFNLQIFQQRNFYL